MKRAASPDSPMFESMHKFQLAQFTVRVWREEEQRQNRYFSPELGVAAFEAADLEDRGEVSACFERCPSVTAVEVLDLNGQGGVVYTVWP